MEQLQGEGRFNRRAILVAEAQRRILEGLEAGKVEVVPLAQARGRLLGKRLTATCDWPPFVRSGLDGYAVRSIDTVGAAPDAPVTLEVIGHIAAGEVANEAIRPGTAMRIMTGAAVPEGADAVIMLEQTQEASEGEHHLVKLKRDAGAGQNATPIGVEYKAGSVVAEAGTVLRSGHIALLATFGYAEVPVYAKPKVAILPTGLELLPVHAPLRPGQIRDSNSGMLVALIEEAGGIPLLHPRLCDDPQMVMQAITEASEEADIILTTGGVSVGDYDVMAAIMRDIRARSGGYKADEANLSRTGQAGNEQEPTQITDREGNVLLFDKVAMRPGSPTSAALMNGKLLLALSGNPAACFVGFELFGRPAMKRLQGTERIASLPRQTTARLKSGFDKGSPHERFVRTRLYVEEAQQFADPLAFNKSSMMASLPESDGLIRIPAGPCGAEAGALVDVIVLN
ncbi:molybdopterin molybdotransferase [Paenibacillus phyllosphaerae]|uniref:Molybdopterin molybdenumtransferase n=1 Tax=Paenibacillus phyllosphaerae TaxID=274593 RepID=A0A7W5B5D2_9BACL|nr:molybdopterin molybdotransferase [Paenibacillus phyllosphaerae]